MAETAAVPNAATSPPTHSGADALKTDKLDTTSSPSTSNRAHLAPAAASSTTSFTSLPPIVTAIGTRRTSVARVPSWANRRVSTFSNSSMLRSSRPQSIVFPAFHSSLPYALVRDFAYQADDSMHYGPPPEPASAPSSTTGSDFPRRLSDPELIIPHSAARTPWSGHPEHADASFYSGPQLPAMAFGDGPPWREDDDLLSPIVTAARHRKTRSDMDYFSSRSREVSRSGGRRTSYAGTNQDGTQTYYVDHKEETMPGGPGGEFITLPSTAMYKRVSAADQDVELPQVAEESPGPSPRYLSVDDNRYSRDYSFSIASPDEEMHGKAIALFDFESENDNELPLVEGQVLWVSYRHGQGWLVAKDPATGEDGLVPEAYVRLEREIQGGVGQLSVQMINDESLSAPETPTAASMGHFRGSGAYSNGTQQYPVVSHFSTSSRDLLPQHARSPNALTPTFGQLEHQMSHLSVQSTAQPTSDEKDDESSMEGDVTETIAPGSSGPAHACVPVSSEATVR